ncbi:SWIM zinc finger family protein [Saccharopolyspora sp. NPDC000359]|uniref:SWIM zinc finger family protein n=1 Tax=Saccharopolyspora sp. NPDC000359 TaxID=3154251 RepID=UPI00332020DA
MPWDEPVRAVTFPAFPPGRRYGRKFADTWWGNAWVEAVESAALDPDQLKKGRKHAFAGQVGAITVSPGRVLAPVHDGDPDQPYRTEVHLPALRDPAWERFLDQVAGRAGHIAALLDRDMPPDLVGAAEDAGVPLLPGWGELEPECDCPGWDNPCKHAAALAYQVSWLLDRDPFVLLLLRGRGEDELTEELHRRNARRSASAEEQAAGTPATEAWAAPVSPLPDGPGEPGELLDLARLLEDAPVDTAALAALAADAADRARDLLSDVDCSVDRWASAVRLAARAGSEELTARAGRLSGRPTEFARAVRAWEVAGQAGLSALEGSWSPPREVVVRARAEIAHAWADAGLEPLEVRHWRNRLTLADRGVQLRFGEDERWYLFRADGSGWCPTGTPATHPVEALIDLLNPAG